MEVRILESRKGIITQNYNESHQGIDLVGENYTLDYIVAHSDGKVVFYQDGYDNIKGSIGNLSYGNYIKIDHGNGFETLYAHMKKNLLVKNGAMVKQGQKIGYMSDSGNAYGKHLHFEVWKDGKRINPTDYLNKNLYENKTTKYKVGDVVTINTVYISSTSQRKLIPLIKTGTITRIVNNVRNPYLLNNGNIGWVNDESIVEKTIYLSNKEYKGISIVEALNEINIDSSYEYRKKLANINDIKDYKGTSSQNIKMLNLLKSGKLIKA